MADSDDRKRVLEACTTIIEICGPRSPASWGAPIYNKTDTVPVTSALYEAALDFERRACGCSQCASLREAK